MRIEIIGLLNIPEITMGDNLSDITLKAINKAGLTLENKDILVFTSKIISKSEGQIVDLCKIKVTKKARGLAKKTKKDERIVQLILEESNEIIRTGKDFIITETKGGAVCANSGIDESNVEEKKAVLLPKSPQKSARKLRQEIEDRTKKQVAILISDSMGRAFRDGVVGTCIGVSGLAPVLDRRGEIDRFGKVSRITKVGFADEICSSANLVMGELKEGIPIVIVRGLTFDRCEADVSDMVFDKNEDVFR